MRWKYVTVFESQKARHPNEHRTNNMKTLKAFDYVTVAKFTPLQYVLHFNFHYNGL